MRLAGIMAAVLAVAGFANAAEKPARVVLPAVKIERGETCVEPTAEMRRNHMNMLLHQRDQTMHGGIRTTQHSLKNCVDCHANPKTNSVLGKDGFCESCHTYAAVRMDCFGCHSPSPQKAASSAKGAVASLDAIPQSIQCAASATRPVTRSIEGRAR